MATQLPEISALSASAARCVEQWAAKCAARVSQWPVEERNEALLAISIDPRWPAASREKAKSVMCEQAVELIPWLFDRASASNERRQPLSPVISDLLGRDPSLVPQFIRKASSRGAPRDVGIAVAAMAHSGSVDNSRLQLWLREALAGSESVRPSIMPPLFARLKALPPSATWWADVRDHYRRSPELERPFLEEVYLPLLRESLTKAQPADVWNAFACRLVEASLDAGMERQELAALAAMHGGRVNGDLLAEWVRQAGDDDNVAAPLSARGARLGIALNLAGLQAPIALRAAPNSPQAIGDAHDRSPRRLPRRRHQPQPPGGFSRAASLVLAGIAAALALLPALYHVHFRFWHDWPALIRPEPIPLLFWSIIAILTAWLIAEFSLSFLRLPVSTARWIRTTILTFLVIGCLLSAYRLGRDKLPIWFPWPAAATKTV